MTSMAASRFTTVGILTDAVRLLGVVLLIPFVVLAVGTPFAAVIAGFLWLARIVRAAL
jgi:hypothetical protein